MSWRPEVGWLLLTALVAPVVSSLALAGKPPPGADLLEFLGSVDSEDGSWSQYLGSTDLEQVVKPGAAKAPAKVTTPADASAVKGPTPGVAQPAVPRVPGREGGLMKNSRVSWLGGMAFLCLQVLAMPVSAAEPEPPAAVTAAPLPWPSLSSAQQDLLGRYADRWAQLPPARQQNLARGATRWLSMDEAARGNAQQRFQTWQDLPEQQRALIRRRWQRYQALGPDQKAAVRENFRRFAQMPPERRAELRREWRDANPTERARMLKQLRQQRPRPPRAPP